MNRSIAIAYGIAGLSAAIATLAVFTLVSGGAEPPPEGPAALAWAPPEAVALTFDPADPAYPQSVAPVAEPPVQYVDEQGRPVAPPEPGARRGEREHDEDDDHEEREHRRGHRERDDD